MTGPRLRTLRLTALCLIGVVILGGTAYASKARRHRALHAKHALTHPKNAGVRAKSTYTRSVHQRKKALPSFRVRGHRRAARYAARPPSRKRAGVGDRGRAARYAVRGPTRAAVWAGRARHVLASRAPAGIRSTGRELYARRRAWLSQRWRQRPPNLKSTPPKRPALDPIAQALRRRAARVAALPLGAASGSLTGELDVLEPDAPNRDLVAEALAARGIRYRWGGASRGGFDCSGFTRYLYARMRGIPLPHSASRQARHGEKVTRDALQPGDLVFFRTYRRGISHVGIYIGGNRFVHAANRRRHVRVDELTGYYAKRYVTARRFGSRVSPPAMPDRNMSVPADVGFSSLEEPGTLHPDPTEVPKLASEPDRPLASDGEPVSVSWAGPPTPAAVSEP